MKRTLRGFALLFSLIFLFSGCGGSKPDALGLPYDSLDPSARVVWDLCLYEGCLYAASGDYDKNVSPEHVMRYVLADGEWEFCGGLANEQINRFLVLEGDLYIPGTDPIGPWTWGSFYRLEEGSFKEYATIPHGVHTFDLAYSDGMLFAALGVDDGRYPVAVSKDGGESFETVPFYRDGVLAPTECGDMVNRVYDLFTLPHGLFAIYFGALYRYDATVGGFCYQKEYLTFPKGEAVCVPIQADAFFRDTLYYTTTEAVFASSPDGDTMTLPTAFLPEGAEKVTDLLIFDDCLYLLGYETAGSDFRVKVFQSDDGESFEEIAAFISPVPAQSFAIDSDGIYFGMGIYGGAHSENGRVQYLPFDGENE